jgi:hypothetical protein
MDGSREKWRNRNFKTILLSVWTKENNNLGMVIKNLIFLWQNVAKSVLRWGLITL